MPSLFRPVLLLVVIGLLGLYCSVSQAQILAPGGSHTLLLSSTGQLTVFGDNTSGRLGDGTTTPRAVPTAISGFSDVKAIAAGRFHSLAVRADGSVWAWGENVSGQLGDGTTTARAVPTKVMGLSGVVQVAAGYAHSVAIKQDGTVWAWGYNQQGQLGDGTRTDRATPVQVPGLSGIQAIAAGDYHSIALKSNGTVWVWGDNFASQVDVRQGQGYVTSPVQIALPYRMVSVTAAGFRSLAVAFDGSVYFWGDNYLADPIPQPLSGIKAVAAGANGGNYALDGNGRVWVWGENGEGQLGDGTTTLRATPVMLSGVSDVVAIGAGFQSAGAIRRDGSVWMWGRNVYGQLGNGMAFYQAPVLLSAWTGTTQFDAGNARSAAIAGGRLWSAGRNEFGELGVGDTSSRGVPVAVAADMAQVSLGAQHTLALDTQGRVWSWGNNDAKQLGDASITRRSKPGQVAGVDNMVQVSASGGGNFSLALRQDGTVWAWGDNSYGQLGDGSKTARATPAMVNGLSNVLSIQAGNLHGVALKSDGTVWSWGHNAYGELGDGSVTDRTTPVQSLGLSGIKAISSRFYHGLALKDDGSLWAWGHNGNGQLGDGTTISRNLGAVAIKGPGTVVAMAAGFKHSAAVDSQGGVWTWGDNTAFQLGDGTNDSRSTPAKIATYAGAQRISAGSWHTLVQTADQLYGWGTTSDGALGLPAMTLYRSVPTQVRGVDGLGFYNAVTATGGSAAPFALQVSAVGSWQALTVEGQLQPHAADIGKAGRIYLAALAGGVWLVHDGGGWGVWNSGVPSSFINTTLAARHGLPLAVAADLSSLSGAQIYAGYGSDFAAMVANGTYGLLYQVPAN